MMSAPSEHPGSHALTLASVAAFVGAVAVACSPLATAFTYTVDAELQIDWRSVSFLELSRRYGFCLLCLGGACAALAALSIWSLSVRIDYSLIAGSILVLALVVLVNNFASLDAIRGTLGAANGIHLYMEHEDGSPIVAIVRGVRPGGLFKWLCNAGALVFLLGTLALIPLRRRRRPAAPRAA